MERPVLQGHRSAAEKAMQVRLYFHEKFVYKLINILQLDPPQSKRPLTMEDLERETEAKE